MSERLDIRLSEKEKEKLAEIAKSKGMSMTDLVRTWIIKGDIAFVLAEQLLDFANDFAKWHVLDNRDTSILYLGANLRHESVPEPTSRLFYTMTNFFEKSSELIKYDMQQLQITITYFLNKTEPREKEKLIALITEFTSIVEKYYRIYVETFMEMFNAVPKPHSSVEEQYNDGFRIRYNEFASKYEDFLKRSKRELGADIARPIQRAKELRAKPKP